MKPIRWGIIGCGAVTEVKSGPALQQAQGSALVAVMRRDAAKARDYARRHGVPRWYADADDLIGDPQVDAVYVATPPDTHAEYTLRAARAGKPVYVEKPMARHADECEAMIAACEAARVPLFVAYYRRRLPTFLKVEKLLAARVIGQVRCVVVQLFAPSLAHTEELPWRVLPQVAGGGLFFDLGSHQFDLLDYLLGPVAVVHGHAANQAGSYPAEDVVSVHFRFASGVVGSGLWCFSCAPEQRRDVIEIIGSRGRISCSTFGRPVVKVETSAGVQTFAYERPDPVQLPLVQTVVDELSGRGRCPSTGSTAARTSRVLDEVVAAYYSESR